MERLEQGHTSNRRRYLEEDLDEARRAVYQEGKTVELEEDLGTLCKGMIRKVMCV